MASSLALLATSRWLIATSVQYLVVAAAATAVAAVLLAPLHPTVKRVAAAMLGALALGLAIAASTQHRLSRLDDDWEAERVRMQSLALDGLELEVGRVLAALRQASMEALDAPPDRATAFESLAEIARGDDVALARYHGESAVAWHGRPPIALESLTEPTGVALTTFHLVLYAVARAGEERAVAVKLLYAVPPADALTSSAGATIARRVGVRGFRFGPPADSVLPGARVFHADGRALFSAAAQPFAQGEMQVHVMERTRLLLGVLLFLSLACFILACWRSHRSLGWRAAVIAVALACVALTPLSAFSNSSRLFNPALYFTPLGGPLTANAAALGLTSALVLLLLLAAVRRQTRSWNRWAGIGVVLLVAGLGPFLLRDLARGIQIPTGGVSASLWLIWEVPLFLAAVCVILTGAAGGSMALGASRGLPAFVAPALATVAAVIAPVVWAAPGQWPWWYTFLWIAAIVSLAVSRRTPALILSAATVAALGATTLVWGSTMRARVRLAEQDVAMLGAGDQDAAALADRFARQVADDPPATKPELLRAYALSDLSAAAYPATLSIWRSPDGPAHTLATAPILVPADSLQSLVLRASNEGAVTRANLPGVPALQHAIAIPVDSGVLTLVVSPRSRLIPYDPFASLLGIALPREAEAPYTMQLASVASGRAATRATWRREGNELHGDWTARTGSGAQRVHVEVELRSLEALVQRGTLIVLLDLGVVGLLWFTSVVADGLATRWISVRRRRWARSYRTRLTVVLFGFFIVPAVAFAVWSYQQLSTDATRARELLVRETLRSVEPGETTREWLSRESRRVQAPLLLYTDGALTAASDTLLLELAPVGRMLPHQVAENMLVHGEVSAHRSERIGEASTLFGYRAMELRAGAAVLAAPARADELALGRRARDLGILVAFATALGALAALWLSGIAARQLARPIGSLRRAALALAAGDRDPRLEGQPTAEFLPVFAAFRRMTADLNASRSALEEAQRRTAAVLRNAASGVIAVDEQGTVTLANPRADELLGGPLPPGTRLADVGPAALSDIVRQFLAGDRDDEEFELPHGQQQWRGRLTRLTRGGAVLTLDDVSEIVRAGRVLAWGEMARQVAHEIKNPLTPIRLGVQHLLRARTDSRVDFDTVLEQNVERILREIDHLDEIARAFSRYGQPPEQRGGAERTDVAAVLRELVDLETMGESGVRWTLEGAAAPVFALARREELREVLLNVLENARLAGARTVGARVVTDDGGVRITVADDGHGVSPEALSRIFEPHFSTRTSGSGLGLAISRRLIESWGGTIGISSEPGQGAMVTITLRT